MIQLFLKGGPMMWPLLLLSFVTVTVVLERIFFTIRERSQRQPETVDRMIALLEKRAEGTQRLTGTASPFLEEAVQLGANSADGTARALASALSRHHESFSSAYLHAAQANLRRFHRGLPILDTAITLAPLLGLLGTVTGMIRSFGMMGGATLDAPVAITGGIAEALIATAFGLGIAILSVIPFNTLNSVAEQERLTMEDVGTRVEILLREHGEHGV